MNWDIYVYQMFVLMSLDKTKIYLTFIIMRKILQTQEKMVTTNLLKEMKLISLDDLNTNSSETEIIWSL